MQIFHLLPAEIMAKWETLEQEFYNGEWTLQVLHVMFFIAIQKFECSLNRNLAHHIATVGFNFISESDGF